MPSKFGGVEVEEKPSGGSKFGGVAVDDGPATEPKPVKSLIKSDSAKLSGPPKSEGVMDSVANWFRDAGSDIRDGGGSTIVGRGLRALGAPGARNGVSPKVGDFMASPFTGPIRAARGVAEVGAGHPIRGVKDVTGGVMEAGQIPGAFMGAANPVSAARALIGGSVAGRAADEAGGVLGLGPDSREALSNVASIAGGGAAASPKTVPFIKGAVKAVPGAIAENVHGPFTLHNLMTSKIPVPAAIGAAAGHMMGHPVAGGIAGAAIGAIPAIIRGGMKASASSPWMPPSEFPKETPSAAPSPRVPIWDGIRNAQSMPSVEPGSKIGQNPFSHPLDPVESLPSGREVGGAHNIPQPAVRPERPAPLWKQYGSGPIIDEPVNFQPIMSDLPSGRFPVSSRFPEAPVAPREPRTALWHGRDIAPQAETPEFTPIRGASLPSGRQPGGAHNISSVPVSRAPIADPGLLDGIARGQSGKRFAALSPEEQLTVRRIAGAVVSPAEQSIPGGQAVIRNATPAIADPADMTDILHRSIEHVKTSGNGKATIVPPPAGMPLKVRRR